jgi:hypothetical protein
MGLKIVIYEIPTITITSALNSPRGSTAFRRLEDAAERPADALRAAQPLDYAGIRLFGQEIGKIRIALMDRRQSGPCAVMTTRGR